MSERTLTLLSCNIQAGARTGSYGEYITRGWSNVLPAGKRSNLDQIAELVKPYDVIGLQESDPGSLRSGFMNQTHYLAERSELPFWSHQPNRRVGGIASSANGLLSRLPLHEVLDYPLPGRLPGRGALLARLGIDARTAEDGCCGMAGAFGFHPRHYAVSAKIGEAALLPAVRAASEDTMIIASGYSCREQIAQMTDRNALHIAEVVALALNRARESAAAR